MQMGMLRLYLYPLVILLSSCSLTPVDKSLTTAETLPSILQAGNITKIPRGIGLLESSIEESKNRGLLQ